MSSDALDRLDSWKGRFGSDPAPLERLLARIARQRFRGAPELIRLHETLLFLRAYPASSTVASLADGILAAFADRIVRFQQSGGDLSVFEDPQVSGIAGTSLAAAFSYPVAQSLAARHPRETDIGWDRYDDIDLLGPALRRIVPLLAEDWPVEAHVPFGQWISAARAAARPATRSDLSWLLQRFEGLPAGEREQLYDQAQVPLLWNLGNSPVSRSRMRLPGRKLYLHRDPLLRRSEISLAAELEGPPLPIRRLTSPEARRILDLIVDTSAMRFRELYGFSHPDTSAVLHVNAGRGVEIYFFGVPPAARLPLRAYHAGMFFKNGVPAGYVEVLSLFERAEVGFNLYYTFREGESAWLYARLLRLCRQLLGVTCFSVDPYQIGDQNPEALDSGAFWFYRKLGFRPTDPGIAALVNREEDRMRRTPGYRSPRRTLEKLAQGYVLYGGDDGAWDQFRVRNVGLSVERAGVSGPDPWSALLRLIPMSSWSTEEKAAATRIARAKHAASESRYLRLMQQHPRLREAFLKLGASV